MPDHHPPPPPASRPRDGRGRCAMYGQCGKRSFLAPPLNCAVDMSAKDPNAKLRTHLVQLCGERYAQGPVCCDAAQVDTLEASIQIANRFVQPCPACWENLKTFWCDFSCSPDQASFVNVTATEKFPAGTAATAVEYHVAPKFSTALFDSCKDIKFGGDNRFVMDFVGGGAKTPQEFLDFMGAPKPEVGGSPFPIKFPVQSTLDFRPHNPPSVPCNSTDTALRCSCMDCAAVCPILPAIREPDPPHMVGTWHLWAVLGLALELLVLTAWLGTFVTRWVRRAWKQRQARNRRVRIGDSEDDLEAPAFLRDDLMEAPLLSPSMDSFPQSPIRDGPFVAADDTNSLPTDPISQLFLALGHVCSHRPKTTILAMLLLVAACSTGWIFNLKLVTRPEDLWVPPDSVAAASKAFYDREFGPFYRTQQVILSTTDPDPNASIVSEETLRQLFALQKAIKHERAPNGLSLNDFCFRPLPEPEGPDGCVVQSVTGYWQDDLATFEKSDWREHLASCLGNPTMPACLPAFLQPLKPELIVDQVNGTRAFIVTFVNRNSDRNATYIDAAEEWESWLRTKFQDAQRTTPASLRLSYSTESSVETELIASTSADYLTIAISYLAMVAYLVQTLRSPTVALSAVTLVLLSVSMAIGTLSWLGVPCTFISLEVIPFLALAIGVDNVFLLVEAREQIHIFPSTPYRIALALARQGPGFLLSFACELLIFLAAALIDIPAVSSFALYAAATVAALFLLQVTLFVAILAMIHVPALKHSGAAWVRYTQILVRYRRALLATVAALSIGSTLLLSNISLGLDQRAALPGDSHMVSYFDDLDRYFSMGPPVYFMAENVDLRNHDHWKAMCARFTACDVNSIPNLLEQERKRPNVSALASPATAWLDDFLYWLQPRDPEDESEEVPACCSRRRKNPGRVLRSGLLHFAIASHYATLLKSVPNEVCPQAGAAAYADAVAPNLDAFTFRAAATPLRSQAALLHAAAAHQRVADAVDAVSPVKVTTYAVFHPFFAQYAHLVPVAWKLVAMVLLIVAVTTTILLGSLHLAGILATAMAIMLLWMSALVLGLRQIPLNGVSLVNIVLGGGLGVEFAAHVLRAFAATTTVVDVEARVTQVLFGAGHSVLNGIGWTKLVGVAVLAFARSAIFRTFYFEIYCAILVTGLAVGLGVLPLLLLTFGGAGKPVEVEERLLAVPAEVPLPPSRPASPVRPKVVSSPDGVDENGSSAAATGGEAAAGVNRPRSPARKAPNGRTVPGGVVFEVGSLRLGDDSGDDE
ncbi:hypothetical protein AMAG_07367 [Allomyces macrogynus ATCC 38327]|uniref:SSD domain-containing protein n=1 Tax=Allomyces macrogynus (strain ATCC 38327) TaxID=578462 RepID=A0A0L0SHY4_ALLM3|nr:hypothetical protein AMAG_07367 [Allomyces macrogynus ATCC 38327]|eukprot:KNE62121.1 hypothetical protein AMAG_07367 [Allomyces macrogynus ATCC 38327]